MADTAVSIALKMQDQASAPIKRAMNQIDRSASTTRKSITKLSDSFHQATTNSNSFTGSIQQLHTKIMGLAAAAAVFTLLTQKTEQYALSIFQTRAVFGDIADEIIQRSKEMAKAVNYAYSSLDVQYAFRKIHDSLKRYGITIREQENLISRAMDVAASRGLQLRETIDRIESAMRGEAEASEYLGLTLSETYMKTTAFGGALEDVWEKLDEGEKARVRYLEFLEQSNKYTDQAANATETMGQTWATTWNKIIDEHGDTLTWINEQLAAMAGHLVDIGIGLFTLEEGSQKQLSGIWQAIKDWNERTGGTFFDSTDFYITPSQTTDIIANVQPIAAAIISEIRSGVQDGLKPVPDEISDIVDKAAERIGSSGLDKKVAKEAETLQAWLSRQRISLIADEYDRRIALAQADAEKMKALAHDNAELMEAIETVTGQKITTLRKEQVEARIKLEEREAAAIQKSYDKLKDFLAIHSQADEAARQIAALNIEYDRMAELLTDMQLAGHDVIEMSEQLDQWYANSMEDITKKTEETTDTIYDTWSHMYERLQDVTADWIYDMKVDFDSLLDLFKRTIAEMISAWIWGQQSMQFATSGQGGFSLGNMFGGMFGGGGVYGSGDPRSSNFVGPLQQGMQGAQSAYSLYGAYGAYQGAGGGWGGLKAGAGSFFGGGGSASNTGFGYSGGPVGWLAAAYYLYTLWDKGIQSAKAARQSPFSSSWERGDVSSGSENVIEGLITGGTWEKWFGIDLFGWAKNKKRSYLGETHGFGDYSPDEGWGVSDWSHKWKDKRDGEKAFGEAGKGMAETAQGLMNALDSMFKNLLDTFDETKVNAFTTAMAELSAQMVPVTEATKGYQQLLEQGITEVPRMSFGYYISAEDEDEFKDDWRESWKRLTANIIDPIVEIGSDLLNQALDGAVTDATAWNYFTDDMREYLRTGLTEGLEGLGVDWFTVTDQESFEAALEQMGLAVEQIANIVGYFETVGAILNDITSAIDMHEFSENAHNAIFALKNINAEFDEYAATLESLDIALEKYEDRSFADMGEKYSDLETARLIAIAKEVEAMSDAAMSGEDLALALQYMQESMEEAGKGTREIAATMDAAYSGVLDSIEDIKQRAEDYGKTDLELMYEKHPEWQGTTYDQWAGADLTDWPIEMLQEWRNLGELLLGQFDDLQAAMEDNTNALEEAQAKMISELEKLAGSLDKATQAISDYRDSLIETSGALSPETSYAYAGAQLDAAVQGLYSDDTEVILASLQSIPALAEDFLRASKMFASTPEQYMADFSRVVATLNTADAIGIHWATKLQGQLMALLSGSSFDDSWGQRSSGPPSNWPSGYDPSPYWDDGGDKTWDMGLASGGMISGPESGYNLPAVTFHGTEHVIPGNQMKGVTDALHEVKELLVQVRDTNGDQNKTNKKLYRIIDKVSQGEEYLMTKAV